MSRGVDGGVVPVASERRVAFTRTRGTSVAFSWRVRVLLSTLPVLPLAVFMWGGLGFGPITWVVVLMTAIACALWWPHVWTRSYVAPAPVVGDATAPPDGPRDLFTWAAPTDLDES